MTTEPTTEDKEQRRRIKALSHWYEMPLALTHFASLVLEHSTICDAEPEDWPRTKRGITIREQSGIGVAFRCTKCRLSIDCIILRFTIRAFTGAPDGLDYVPAIPTMHLMVNYND